MASGILVMIFAAMSEAKCGQSVRGAGEKKILVVEA